MRYRTFSLQIENRTEGAKFYPAVLSSESPVERDYGTEILDHSPGAVDQSRTKRGLPLLWAHDNQTVVGRVERIRLTDDRKLRGELRPGNSERAKEIWADIGAGVITDLSIGYSYGKSKPTKRSDGALVFKNWQPLEVSLVAIPADTQAGIGRSNNIYSIRKEKNMDENYDIGEVTPKKSYTELERMRVQGIRNLCKQNNIGRDLENKMIDDALSVDEASTVILNELKTRSYGTQTYSARDIGMSQSEVKRYSIARAIVALATNDWTKAGLEREASRAFAQRTGRDPLGFFVPSDVLLQTRTVQKTGTGAYTIATETMAGNFIDMLRNRAQVMNLGATVLNGLVGDVAIPRQSGTVTANWVAESTAPNASDLTLGQILLSPNTVAALTSYSRKMLLQSTPGIEQIITADLANVVAIAIDLAALSGTGADNQPRGILYHTNGQDGIGEVTCSGGLTWAKVVEFESTVAGQNADMGSLGYLTSPTVRGALKSTFRNSTYGEVPIWEADAMNGYKALVTKNCTDAQMIFGNWADLIIGEWGGIDIATDPYGSNFGKGDVSVRVLADVDVALRHPESFAIATDIP